MRYFFLHVTVIVSLPAAVAAQQASAVPAAASAAVAPAPASSTPIPEPGDLALFLIGVAGLIVGRWTARSRNRNPE